ncbi:MAG: hypothetical protein PHC54_06400 [Candidatus Omnitrophica bacterium]|nr:hypothetical protein [Candidatus Omnitrophota bacterium]MDD5592851.1 hypothetical protein [Candidatus Omnitrophota bacterium]
MNYFRIINNEKWLSNFALVLVLASIIIYSIFIQFLLPTFHEADEYYHIAASSFLKDLGPRYDFHWAQFSTFKRFFSDKEFLFHLLTIPFLSLSQNLVLDGKYAIIFFDILFILTYAFILKRYLPTFLAACCLLLPFVNFTFITYFVRLRPVILANILTILGIYFLINKKWIRVFIVSFLYPLTHISFLTLLIFALACELIRYILNKDFFIRNIYATVIGVLLGCALHPNNPNNWLSMHLNAILVPFYTTVGGIGGFGRELYSASSKAALVFNFSIFLAFYLVIWMAFLSRVKLSLATLVWWFCSSFYLALSFLGFRYWHVANVLFFIFFASYIKDWLIDKPKGLVISRARIFIIASSLILGIFFFPNIQTQANTMLASTIRNTAYEKVAIWMNKNIPPGETVYHTSWSASPYFICLNPKDNYLVVLDPIYMFYKYPKIYKLYLDLNTGNIKRPYKFLKHIFKTAYGYADKNGGLYRQIKKQKSYFKIIYENDFGIVFKVL